MVPALICDQGPLEHFIGFVKDCPDPLQVIITAHLTSSALTITHHHNLRVCIIYMQVLKNLTEID